MVGDCGGTLNVPKIKGTHTAMRSAMIAAEHLHENALNPVGYDSMLRSSAVSRELKKVRNIRPGFRWGLWGGLVNAGFETVTMGLAPWTLTNHADHTATKKLSEYHGSTTDYRDRDLAPKDRLASVYMRRPNMMKISLSIYTYSTPKFVFQPAWKNTITPVPGSAPLMYTKWWKIRTTSVICRSILRTASIARPAISRTPTESLPG